MLAPLTTSILKLEGAAPEPLDRFNNNSVGIALKVFCSGNEVNRQQ
jgi:hypothetical protein